MPGAFSSMRRVAVVLTAPLPSMGWPRALTTRPSCFSYSLICSRMMSLISAARICIAVFPPGRRLAAAHGHLLRQASELGPQAPIVDRPADVEHHTPEQLWVEIGGGKDISPARQAAR